MPCCNNLNTWYYQQSQDNFYSTHLNESAQFASTAQIQMWQFLTLQMWGSMSSIWSYQGEFQV